MTPCIRLLKQQKTPYITHEYKHEKLNSNYGNEASTLLNISKNQIFKTLIIQLNTNELIVAIVPVSSQLNIKLLCKYLNVKKAKMADKYDVLNSTGYILGAVSPIAQKKKLKTIIDISSTNYKNIYVSAGKRGLEIQINVYDLVKITNAKFHKII